MQNKARDGGRLRAQGSLSVLFNSHYIWGSQRHPLLRDPHRPQQAQSGPRTLPGTGQALPRAAGRQGAQALRPQPNARLVGFPGETSLFAPGRRSG